MGLDHRVLALVTFSLKSAVSLKQCADQRDGNPLDREMMTLVMPYNVERDASPENTMLLAVNLWRFALYHLHHLPLHTQHGESRLMLTSSPWQPCWRAAWLESMLTIGPLGIAGSTGGVRSWRASTLSSSGNCAAQGHTVTQIPPKFFNARISLIVAIYDFMNEVQPPGRRA